MEWSTQGKGRGAGMGLQTQVGLTTRVYGLGRDLADGLTYSGKSGRDFKWGEEMVWLTGSSYK